MQDQKEIMIKLSTDAWHGQVKRADKFLDALTDDDLQEEVSPGRNRGVYLLGHLAAVHDMMLPLLGFGERMYKELDEAFISNPDKTITTIQSTEFLRNAWKTVNAELATHINQLTADGWLQKHTAVKEEDFIKEPHRNKLNVLISRTNHLAYHFGQLAFLKK